MLFCEITKLADPIPEEHYKSSAWQNDIRRWEPSNLGSRPTLEDYSRGPLYVVKRLNAVIGYGWYGRKFEEDPDSRFLCQSRFEAYWRTLLADRIGPPEGGAFGDWGYLSEKGAEAQDQFDKWRRLPHDKAPTNTDLERMGPYAWARLSSEQKASELAPFLTIMKSSTYGRRFCELSNGYFALVPSETQLGDLICVLVGGLQPFVLRRSAKGLEIFRLIGACYVHGIMEGEALRGFEAKGEAMRTFVVE